MIEFDYARRIARLRSVVSAEQVDAALLSVGSDLPHFTGYKAMASERPTMLVARSVVEPVLFIPTLEAPRVD